MTFGEKMKAVAESVGLSDPVVVQGMYIFKQPRIGTEGMNDRSIGSEKDDSTDLTPEIHSVHIGYMVHGFDQNTGFDLQKLTISLCMD